MDLLIKKEIENLDIVKNNIDDKNEIVEHIINDIVNNYGIDKPLLYDLLMKNYKLSNITMSNILSVIDKYNINCKYYSNQIDKVKCNIPTIMIELYDKITIPNIFIKVVSIGDILCPFFKNLRLDNFIFILLEKYYDFLLFDIHYLEKEYLNTQGQCYKSLRLASFYEEELWNNETIISYFN